LYQIQIQNSKGIRNISELNLQNVEIGELKIRLAIIQITGNKKKMDTFFRNLENTQF